MTQITTFGDMYVAELQELASLEAQLGNALPMMAQAASHPSLRSALFERYKQGGLQLNRLLAILQEHGADPHAHTDQAMQALVNETAKMLTLLEGDDLCDAGLIASAKIEHYEIAAYGTAAALAGQLDLRDEQRLLHESLEEEKQMDVLLTELAKSEVNLDALAA